MANHRRVEREPSSKRVEFLLTPSEHADMIEVARENGLPLSALIREAVNEYVADYRDKRVFYPTNYPVTSQQSSDN